MAVVPFDKLSERCELSCVGVMGSYEPLAEAIVQRAFAVENVRLSTGHSGAEVEPHATEDDHGAGGHVLTGVITDTFDHGHRAGVANREPLAR